MHAGFIAHLAAILAKRFFDGLVRSAAIKVGSPTGEVPQIIVIVSCLQQLHNGSYPPWGPYRTPAREGVGDEDEGGCKLKIS